MKLSSAAVAALAGAALNTIARGGRVYLPPEEVDLGQDCQHPRLRQAVIHYRGVAREKERITGEQEEVIGELRQTIARLEGEVAACNESISAEGRKRKSWKDYAERLVLALEASIPSIGLVSGVLGVYYRPQLLRLLNRIAPRIPWDRLCRSAATTPTTIYGGGERLPAATSCSPIYRPPVFSFPSPPSTLPVSIPSLPRSSRAVSV